MSTVTIRMEAYARRGGPQRAAELFVDGRRIYKKADLDANREAIPDGYAEVEGVQYPLFKPGAVTYALSVDGAPLLTTHVKPARALTDDGMVEYTWRDVEVTA